MGLNKRQRIAIGTGLAAVGALFADRLLFLPGPSSASAAAGAGVMVADEAVDLEELRALAVRLRSVCEASPAWVESSDGPTPDAFASPWASLVEADVEVAPEQADIEPETVAGPVVAPASLPRLTGIALADDRSYAVLDGRPLALGDSREGFTLLEIGRETVRVRSDATGSVHTLRLHRQFSP